MAVTKTNGTVKLFLSILKNPLIKLTIKFSTKKCPKCDKSHLETALDDYVSNGFIVHHISGELMSKVVRFALGVGGRAFGVNRDQLKVAIQNPYFRRGLTNVLRSIAEYGVTKPQRLVAPFLVVWNYTNSCNLNCKHCYQEAPKPALDELSTRERRGVVDQLCEAGVVSVAFSGGEPLMQGDFYEVARYAADRGMYISLATNGTLIDRERAEKMRLSGVGYAEVSLDGATPEIHDSFRGVSGCFEKTVQGIKHLVRAGIYTCIATTVTRNNFHEVPRILELAKELKVRRVIIFNFIPTGRGERIVDLDLTPDQREQLLKYLFSELVEGEVEALCTAPQYARVCLQESVKNERDFVAPTHFYSGSFFGRTKSLADFIGGCGAGRIYCAIQPNGLVTPCVFMPIVVGDLKKQSLEEIWLHSRVLNELRDRERLKGRCGHCLYKYVCGGCRARAYAYHHDYLKPDPGCIREFEEPSIPF